MSRYVVAKVIYTIYMFDVNGMYKYQMTYSLPIYIACVAGPQIILSNVYCLREICFYVCISIKVHFLNLKNKVQGGRL